VVLRDDEFATIAVAIREGRIIFDNLRKFAVYLVSCNLSEILIVGLAALADAPLPILPLQILFLNLVTDVFPALALGVGEGDDTVMERPPRPPGESFLTRRLWGWIAGYALVLAAAVLLAFYLAHDVLGLDGTHAVSVSFLVLALGQLVHVFNMAEARSKLLANEISRNPWVWAAVGLCLALLAAGIYAPGLSRVLEVRPPSLEAWALIAGASLLPLVFGLPARAIARRRRRGN
jgi:Ca2+-transporting ATPase